MSRPDRLFMPFTGPQIARPEFNAEATEYRRFDPEAWLEMRDLLIAMVQHRRPDEFIGGTPEDPYLERWHLVRDPDHGNVYLHHMRHDDAGRDFHDHPWPNVSIVLSGIIREVMPEGTRLLYPGSIVYRDATQLHRLEVEERDIWTLFITGKKVQEWGFQTKEGWVHQEIYRGIRQEEAIHD